MTTLLKVILVSAILLTIWGGIVGSTAGGHEQNNWSFCTNGELNPTCIIDHTYATDGCGKPIDVNCEYTGGWVRVPLDQPDSGGNPRYPPTVIRTICGVR